MKIKFNNVPEEEFSAAIKKLEQNNVVQRIFSGDFTLWSNSPDEITNRLGWLNSPRNMLSKAADITEFIDELKNDGFKHVVLLGMGGSSLSAEVFSKLFYNERESPLKLTILDSTHPEMVKFTEETISPGSSLFIVATKSGGTVETLSTMKYFYNKLYRLFGSRQKAGEHFIAITDPHSKLVKLAEELKFKKIFENNPDIGGRFSALSYFGILPAAMVGADLIRILTLAHEESLNTKSKRPVPTENIGAALGTFIGMLANKGRNKLTLFHSFSVQATGNWVEQLIAESTGKDGKGILPVNDETPDFIDYYSSDRLAVITRMESEKPDGSLLSKINSNNIPYAEIVIENKEEIGALFFAWEFATAVAGWFLSIHPFNQPNVESTKNTAREIVENFLKTGSLDEPEPCFDDNTFSLICSEQDKLHSFEEAFEELRTKAENYSYASLQAYGFYAKETIESIAEIRFLIQKKLKLTTTFGFGPRFLHSTGQLHKGDDGKGFFIQLFEDSKTTIFIPDDPLTGGERLSFNTLIKAQSLADRLALIKAGRQVLRFEAETKNFLSLLNRIKDSLKKI